MRSLHHGSDLELPDHTVVVCKSLEYSPIFERLRFSAWKWHIANVRDSVYLTIVIVENFGLVDAVKDVHQFTFLPYGICPKNVVIFVLVPVDVTDGKVIVPWHLERSLPSDFTESVCLIFFLNSFVEVVHEVVVHTLLTHLD